MWHKIWYIDWKAEVWPHFYSLIASEEGFNFGKRTHSYKGEESN